MNAAIRMGGTPDRALWGGWSSKETVNVMKGSRAESRADVHRKQIQNISKLPSSLRTFQLRVMTLSQPLFSRVNLNGSLLFESR